MIRTRAAARSRRRIGPCAQTDARDRRLLRRERDVGAGRAAAARPQPSPTRTSRTSAGGSSSRRPTAANQEGVYWRYELVRARRESRLGSVTGGNGSIYALRRADYVEVDPRFGHDLSLPYLMAQRGMRAVYEPEARASEKPTPSNETEYRRKVRMFEHCWLIVLRGRMLARPAARLPRRAHLAPASPLRERACSTSSCSPRRSRCSAGLVYEVALGLQLGLLAAAARGVGIARYYVLVTLGDRRLALELPAARRAGDVEARGGDAVNRAPTSRSRARRSSSSSPLLALAALAIKLDGGGPVLFRQTRVGKDGVDFELLKLRTMVVGAEKMGAGLRGDEGDSRITRAGRVLRKLSLDELPQFWNVVRGDMSSSARGRRSATRSSSTRRQMRRLEVRPGITGWAQIHGRATLPWAERIELDVWYVDHRDWKTDLLILVRTPLALFGSTYKGRPAAGRRRRALTGLHGPRSPPHP